MDDVHDGGNTAFLQESTSKMFIISSPGENFMLTARRSLRRAALVLASALLLLLPAAAAEKPRVKALDYVIDAEIAPKTHQLTGHAKIKFTVLDDTNFASFELNNGLRPTRITDENGKALTAERISQDNVIRVAFPSKLANVDDSPVEGLKLAYIGEDVTYLLYPGRWFPITNYGIDRFTASINVTAPAGTTILGSGATGAPKNTGAKTVASFSWQKPGFPGSIIAGPFTETVGSGGNVRIYTSAAKKPFAPA